RVARPGAGTAEGREAGECRDGQSRQISAQGFQFPLALPRLALAGFSPPPSVSKRTTTVTATTPPPTPTQKSGFLVSGVLSGGEAFCVSIVGFDEDESDGGGADGGGVACATCTGCTGGCVSVGGGIAGGVDAGGGVVAGGVYA